jgi:hypothetical protein
MAITDQQWLDHANQNNQEFSNRQILLKGNGPPSNTGTPAPFGSFYKDNNNGDRYEQLEVDPNTNGYNWQLFTSGGSGGDSDSIIDIRPCDSSLAVGDLVHESKTVAQGVDEVINNTDKRLVVGIVLSKPSSTSAEIMFLGPLTGLSGYSTGSKVYRGTLGEITDTLPSTGLIQVLGNSSDGTHIDFKPATTQIQRA